jgi:hypothetical protein
MLRIPVIPATQSSAKLPPNPVEAWFLPNFGDSGQLQQNRHEPVERSKLENPGESMEKRSIFSLPAQPSPGVHQNWP